MSLDINKNLSNSSLDSFDTSEDNIRVAPEGYVIGQSGNADIPVKQSPVSGNDSTFLFNSPQQPYSCPIPQPYPGSGPIPQPYPDSGPIPQPYPGSGPIPQPYPGSGPTPQPFPGSNPRPQPPAPSPKPVKKKSKTGLIIGILVALIALLSIGAVFGAKSIGLFDSDNEIASSEPVDEDSEIDSETEETDSDSDSNSEPAQESGEESEEGEEQVTTHKSSDMWFSKISDDSGKTLNIYCWNSEFAYHMAEYLPNYTVSNSSDPLAGGMLGDIKVVFHQVNTDNNNYRNTLDQKLKTNESAGQDAIDIYLVEPDYAGAYVNHSSSTPIGRIGITDDELSKQYPYAIDMMTDIYDAIKGISYNNCPGAMIYNRKIAKEVFGTDDPNVIQQKVSSIDAFKSTAVELKRHGYKTLASYDEMYKLYADTTESLWVDNSQGKCLMTVDPNLKAWADDMRYFADNGMISTTNNGNPAEQWSDAWSEGFFPDKNVFCYFGPSWYIKYCMYSDMENSIAANGGWASCAGPKPFYWGGTCIIAATGTDNPNAIAYIMREFTLDNDVVNNLIANESTIPNNIDIVGSYTSSSSIGYDEFGGQNPIGDYHRNALKMRLSYSTLYDYDCFYNFKYCMYSYIAGASTYDEALISYFKESASKHPELTY